jgi:hypothetical protein
MSARAKSNEDMSEHRSEEFVLRILTGRPDDAEVAAVSAVLVTLAAARNAPDPDQGRPVAGGWADPARRLRRPPVPAPGAWRASAWL